MKIMALNPDEWRGMSADAFRLVFKGACDPQIDRINFALLAVDEDAKQTIGYLTAREMNAEDLCWEYGGCFPEYANTPAVYHAYMFFARYCQTRYKRLFQVVENTNHRYLKLSLKLGFNIVGVRHVKGVTLVEMLLEF